MASNVDGIHDLLRSPYPLVVAVTAIVVSLIFFTLLRKTPKKSDQDVKAGDKPVTSLEPEPAPPTPSKSSNQTGSTPGAGVQTAGGAYVGSGTFSGDGGNNFGNNSSVNNTKDQSSYAMSGGSNNAIVRGDNSGNKTTHNRYADKQYNQNIDTMQGDANMGEGQRNAGSRHFHGGKPRRQTQQG